jgi:hypothetical protein
MLVLVLVLVLALTLQLTSVIDALLKGVET